MGSDLVVLPDTVKVFSAATQSATPFSMSFNNVTETVNADVQTALADVFSGNSTGADAVAKIQALYAADPLIK